MSNLYFLLIIILQVGGASGAGHGRGEVVGGVEVR